MLTAWRKKREEKRKRDLAVLSALPERLLRGIIVLEKWKQVEVEYYDTDMKRVRTRDFYLPELAVVREGKVAFRINCIKTMEDGFKKIRKLIGKDIREGDVAAK